MKTNEWAAGEQPSRIEYWLTWDKIIQKLTWDGERYSAWVKSEMALHEDNFERQDMIKAHNEALKKISDRAVARLQ